MPAIMDTFPYPWPVRDAQILHRRLVEMYPDKDEARGLASRVGGIDVYAINFATNPLAFWEGILDKAALAGKVRDLVRLVRDTNPNPAVATFLDALLADQPTLKDPEPRGVRNEPSFDDTIDRKETLLFLQDLSEPIALVPEVIAGAQQALARAAGVCRLRVTIATGQEYYGTGFRIGHDLLLTNHHVLLPEGHDANHIVAEFGYELDAKSVAGTVRSIVCDPATVQAEAPDDWGVVRAPGMDASIPVIPLPEGRVPLVGERAYIVQHPGGAYKRLGFVRNRITEVTNDRVRYLTDTGPGSSGSPVFDGSGKLVALHHAGGTPQKVVGHDPAQKNEGIRIDRVLDRLKMAGLV